ncbi:hypothetical protein B0H13DRAFT_2403973 [Mycena leptocephala]|nr:hypothetical protein B0H13DRAFT_2403973 [Mycena leptocephala]
MPPQPTVTQIRLNNITECLTITANTLEILASSLKSPFLAAVSNTTQSLLKNIQTVRQNKHDCTQLLEQSYELLNAILMVHINSDTGANCHQVSMVNHMKDITQMQEDAEMRNTEVLAMIEALSDTTSSDRSSSVRKFYSTEDQIMNVAQISGLYSGSNNSSNSISMLPSEPKIFHGRDSELSDILHLFGQGTPRIAILGAGRMGKTSLARAIIHRTEITERYNQHQFFVACDSAATQVELAALIGAHVGLKPGKDLTCPVIQYLSSSSKSLLILDNLETLWEPVESRGKIEEFLSLLTDIADSTHDPKEVDKVLSLTDNLPLAIDLVAHLVDSEGCSHVLSRWEEEKTSLISDGYDRTSNLDLSVSLSLSSSRLNPHSKDLLSLLSMLPDGLSDVELVQSKLPVDSILGCKAALIHTALAYSDEHKRLKNGLQQCHPDLVNSVYCVCYLNSFSRLMGQGAISLLQHIQNVLPYPHDHCLEAYFDMEWLNSQIYSISNPDTLISDALDHFKEFDDPDLKCRLYNVLAAYYRVNRDLSSAKKFCEVAISLAISTGNTKLHSQGLHNLAWVEWNLGDYSAAQVHAMEAQRLAIISADLYKEAQALDIEATCCYTLGNYTKAMSLCIRARDLVGLCGMSHGTLDLGIMNKQAEIHWLKSEYVEAHSIHTRILEGTTIQDPYNYGWALLNVAEIDVLIGAPKDDVQRNCDRARKISPPEGGKSIGSNCKVNP